MVDIVGVLYWLGWFIPLLWWILAVVAVGTKDLGWQKELFTYGVGRDANKRGWVVPKVFFWHFYAVALVGVLGVGIGVEAFGWGGGNVRPGLVLFGMHVLKRLLEHFVLHVPRAKFSCEEGREKGSVLPLAVYVGGILHYIGAPLTFSPLIGEYEGAPEYFVVIGFIVWMLGEMLQTWGHWELAEMRRRRNSSKVYVIPDDGPFGLLSIAYPHYLGEILVYIGITLSDGIPFLGCAAWTTSNLLVTASRGWLGYEKRFGKDEWKRKGPQWVIIPEVW